MCTQTRRQRPVKHNDGARRSETTATATSAALAIDGVAIFIILTGSPAPLVAIFQAIPCAVAAVFAAAALALFAVDIMANLHVKQSLLPFSVVQSI